jgi:hypothetical protein
VSGWAGENYYLPITNYQKNTAIGAWLGKQKMLILDLREYKKVI